MSNRRISLRTATDEVWVNLHQRIGVCGPPKSGKTTFASQFASHVPVVHTDAWMGSSWREQPFQIMAACAEQQGGYIVEGVQVARALRKGLELDLIYWINRPRVPLSEGQVRMLIGLDTIRKSLPSDVQGRIVEIR